MGGVELFDQLILRNSKEVGKMVEEFVLLPPRAFNSELIYYLLPKIELQ